jgi:predicted transcriptional regulator
MKDDIKIEVKDDKESAQEFVRAWKRAERGESVEEPVDRLYFPDLETLLRTLTIRRLELLKLLHRTGTTSIRSLAALVRRDYKNVYQDVKTLEKTGLVIRGEKGFSVPWARIVAEIPLAA